MPESERMRIRPLFSEAEGHPDVEPLQYADNNSTGSWDVFLLCHFIECMCVDTCVSQHVYGGQRTTCRVSSLTLRRPEAWTQTPRLDRVLLPAASSLQSENPRWGERKPTEEWVSQRQLDESDRRHRDVWEGTGREQAIFKTFKRLGTGGTRL